MTKYKEYCQNMMREHKELFDHFREIHDRYALAPDKHQDEYNTKGAKIMQIIKDWEDKLCNRSEGSGYGSFTAKLAEKFMEEIKKDFPMIESVGITRTKMKPVEKREIKMPGAPSYATEPAFELNQISPNSFDIKKINL